MGLDREVGRITKKTDVPVETGESWKEKGSGDDYGDQNCDRKTTHWDMEGLGKTWRLGAIGREGRRHVVGRPVTVQHH